MQIYPDTAIQQLEFDQMKGLLHGYCATDQAKTAALNLSVSTSESVIRLALQQTDEYLHLLNQQQGVAGDFSTNLKKELRLLQIEGAVFDEKQLVEVRKMLDAAFLMFKWFDTDRRTAYPGLYQLLGERKYQDEIRQLITEVVDDFGNVRDNASEALRNIRVDLTRARHALRRAFDHVLKKWQKLDYVAEIEESFLSGRRVVAIYAEHKRAVKGILHGESESRRIVFVEPEETIELNNEVFSLERDERQEIYKILKLLTAQLAAYSPDINAYYQIIGQFDFVRAKAKLALSMNASCPQLQTKPIIQLKDAYHPLLYLHNKTLHKNTVPVNLSLDANKRLMIISGPNAGGKTVTLKTVGLLQLMLQSGLLVPAHPQSSFGIFKKIMIHIGDTQSIEQNLSTYSSHLLHLKYFMEHADAHTLFFIDELGSGSDPNLGGAFAEVILQELVNKKSFGIVTTHYLNLKLMADHVPGILNAAMGFDETTMLPLYQLIIGKPGSSYTFAIAERIGLPKHLIEEAQKRVNQNHYRLDKLLNQTQQQLRIVAEKEKSLKRLIYENNELKSKLSNQLDREQHRQQVELLKQKNKINEERLVELKDLDRKLKAIIQEWRRAEDKSNAMKQIQILLFGQKQKMTITKKEKQILDQYEETGGEIETGALVRSITNRKVGVVKEVRGKQVFVQIGNLPISIRKEDLVRVVKKEQ
ncbi:MAG: endonuclease MutS2 [Bacteroidota bacterium]